MKNAEARHEQLVDNLRRGRRNVGTAHTGNPMIAISYEPVPPRLDAWRETVRQLGRQRLWQGPASEEIFQLLVLTGVAELVTVAPLTPSLGERFRPSGVFRQSRPALRGQPLAIQHAGGFLIATIAALVHYPCSYPGMGAFVADLRVPSPGSLDLGHLKGALQLGRGKLLITERESSLWGALAHRLVPPEERADAKHIQALHQRLDKPSNGAALPLRPRRHLATRD